MNINNLLGFHGLNLGPLCAQFRFYVLARYMYVYIYIYVYDHRLPNWGFCLMGVLQILHSYFVFPFFFVCSKRFASVRVPSHYSEQTVHCLTFSVSSLAWRSQSERKSTQNRTKIGFRSTKSEPRGTPKWRQEVKMKKRGSLQLGRPTLIDF